MIAEIVLHLIVLHSVDGRETSVNPKQVTSLHASRDDQKNELITEHAHCVVGLADGKFVSVVEPCGAVRKLLEEDE